MTEHIARKWVELLRHSVDGWSDDDLHVVRTSQVRDVDRLTTSMDRGEVLHGFRETPITFPPSFKW